MKVRPEPSLFPAMPGIRERIEQAIESLLALLDTIDGDPDLEPSLGAPEVPLPSLTSYLPDRFAFTSQEPWADGGGDEREADPAQDGIADIDGLARVLGRNLISE